MFVLALTVTMTFAVPEVGLVKDQISLRVRVVPDPAVPQLPVASSFLATTQVSATPPYVTPVTWSVPPPLLSVLRDTPTSSMRFDPTPTVCETVRVVP